MVGGGHQAGGGAPAGAGGGGGPREWEGARPPPPFACTSGTQIGGLRGNGNWRPPSPLAYNDDANGARANPEAVAPLFCAPRPSQRGHANWGPRANPSTPGFGTGATREREAAREWERAHPSPFAPPFALCAQWWSVNQGPCANPEAAPPPPARSLG